MISDYVLQRRGPPILLQFHSSYRSFFEYMCHIINKYLTNKVQTFKFYCYGDFLHNAIFLITVQYQHLLLELSRHGITL